MENSTSINIKAASEGNIIDGKRIAQEIKDELKEQTAKLKEQGMKGCLAVIQVGADPASSV